MTDSSPSNGEPVVPDEMTTNEDGVEMQVMGGNVHRSKHYKSVEEEEADQATLDTINPGGRFLRYIGLKNCFGTKVKKPGDKLEQIELRVPFTKSFVWEQRKAGAANRKSNEIITSKYNIYTFIPVAALYQFRRFTNAFYLFVAVITIVGYYVRINGLPLWTVPFSPGTVIALLAVVIGVALIFEGNDDIKRHIADHETNGKKVDRIRNGKLEEAKWGELLPGDFIVVNDREEIPADMIVLFTYGADKKGATCYIETSGIDGETNLKIKEVPSFMTQSLSNRQEIKSSLASVRSARQLTRETSTRQFLQSQKDTLAEVIPRVASGTYYYEQPNVFLQFNGSFAPRTADDGTKHPLEFKSLLLRGSTLRNTKWIIGVVAYAGPETKLAMSRKPAPVKLGRIDYFMNKILWGITAIYFIIVVVADLLVNLVAPNTGNFWYFQYSSSTVGAFATPPGIAYFFTYVVLLYNIIPITIIIIVEVINFYSQFMLRQDLELYHDKTDTRAACRTSNLVAEIGQITHIFSDKTGTLTRNEMKMIGFWVNEKMYGFVPPYVDPDTGEVHDEKPPEHVKTISSIATSSASVAPPPEGESFDIDADRVQSSAAAIPNATSSESQMDLERGIENSQNTDDDDNNNNDDKDSKSSMKSIQVDQVFADVIDMIAEEETEDNKEERQAVLDFLVLLSVCHTVVLDWDENGDPYLNSESPDEEAFVKAAGVIGIELVSTADGKIKIKLPNGEEQEYRVLAINPFNSSRKRMSMVLNRSKDNSFVLMMKGADNKMLERIAPGQEEMVENMNATLVQYSWNGLRTLVMGKRELTQQEYIPWEKKYKEALIAPSSERSAAIAAAAEMIENNVTILGASAIEDQLQLGVPQSIQTLRDAGIQVWVLTGDKVETAINIGLSSNLIDSKMLQLKLLSTDPKELANQLDEIIGVLNQTCTQDRGMAGKDQKIDELSDSARDLNLLQKECDQVHEQEASTNHERSWLDMMFGWWYSLVLRKDTSSETQANVALIISGVSLEFLLASQKGTPELEAKLLKIARCCKVVLACRVSPAQKSLIVEMVRYAPDVKRTKRPPITLAIGDGANDVPMIQSAHVGVGISGHEGRQAVNSSDFSIAQFRFLVRLLLVHGRWNYRRLANVIVYVVYSWLIYAFLLYIFMFFSLFSGQQVFYYTAYVTVFAYFANVAIVAHGWFERDISPEMVLRNPWTYAIGVKSADLNTRKVMTLTLRAVVHTILIWFFIFLASDIAIPIDILGASMYVGLLMVLYTEQFLFGSTYTSITVLVFVLDFVLFIIFVALVPDPSPVFTSAYSAQLWIGVILAMASVMIIEMVVRYVKKEFFPRPLDLLIEQDRGYFLGEKHARRAHVDGFKVLEEFGKITVLPFTVGVDAIKEAIEKEEQHKRERAAAAAASAAGQAPESSIGAGAADSTNAGVPTVASSSGSASPSTSSSKGFSSTFSRMAPAFDFDYSSIGSGVKKIRNELGKISLPHTHKSSKQEDVTQSEMDDEDNGISLPRIDLFDYEYDRPNEQLDPIGEDEEGQKDTDSEVTEHEDDENEEDEPKEEQNST